MRHAAAFSFYPGKNRGALGESRAITTNCESAAQISRRLRQCEDMKPHSHGGGGYKARVDFVQRGLFRDELRYPSRSVKQRRGAAEHYRKLCAPLPVGVRLPQQTSQAQGALTLYVIWVQDRNERRESSLKPGSGPRSTLRFPAIFTTRSAMAAANQVIFRQSRRLPVTFCRCRCHRTRL